MKGPVEQEKETVSQVAKGRQTDVPFAVEVVRGFLGLGLQLGRDETGMVVIKSISTRSPVAKDGNIRSVVLLTSRVMPLRNSIKVFV